MTQHGKGGVRFSTSEGTVLDTNDARLSRLELAVANLEEKVKTLEMTVNDIRWGQKEAGEDSLIEEERT